LSQRPARAVPDCAEYRSAYSTMSATAASLRTRRFFFTACGRARGERESSPCGGFRLREVRFSVPWRQRRVPVQDCSGAAPCLVESVRGHTRSAFPNRPTRPAFRRIVSVVREGRCSVRSWTWLHNMTVYEGLQQFRGRDCPPQAKLGRGTLESKGGI